MSLRTGFNSDWTQIHSNLHFLVMGIFDSEKATKDAALKLFEKGINKENIKISIPNRRQENERKMSKSNILSESTLSGALAGSIIGGSIGWLIAIGAFTLKSVSGFFLTSAPIISSITGLSVGGFLGSIAGAILGYSFYEFKKEKNSHTKSKTQITLSIQCPDSDSVNNAKKLLEVTGAHNIFTVTES